MDPYELTLAIIGAAALAAAWLPKLLENRPLSPLLVMVALGAAVYALPLDVDLPDPFQHREVLERVTEMGVLIALMGAGLKIDRRLGWRPWRTTWRLLFVAMPLFIVAGAVLGNLLLGLAPASALLLAAVLAPTDPVLAGDVQVGEPGGPEEDEVRFSLTSEAGMNDGLAFPFVYAAIAMAEHGANPAGWLGEWLAIDVVVRLAIGLALGLGFGRLLGFLVFRVRFARRGVAETAEGFVVLAAMFLVYGMTELVHGYGFLAVFVAAGALRDYEREHEYHRVLHGFAEQIERVFTVALLVVFGGALAQGLLSGTDWRVLAFVAVLLLVLRPATSLLSLRGSVRDDLERRAIAFYGVRGVGSFYYLAYATSTASFVDARRLWAIVAAVVLASLVVHGTSAGPVMAVLDRRRVRRRWARRHAARAPAA
jgi:NhaP-type Na+/H+ or K+/H+ antiporter